MDSKQRVEGREELSEGNCVSERAEWGRKLGDEAEATAAMAERAAVGGEVRLAAEE